MRSKFSLSFVNYSTVFRIIALVVDTRTTNGFRSIFFFYAVAICYRTQRKIHSHKNYASKRSPKLDTTLDDESPHMINLEGGKYFSSFNCLVIRSNNVENE